MVPENIRIGDETILQGLHVGDKIRVYFDYFTPTGGPLNIREYGGIVCGSEGQTVFVKFGEYCCDGLNPVNTPGAPPDVFTCMP
ncbi:MAG: hypothetical protein HY917_05365 [Candidatus Diapherotrites archaeon]|nr:hypothetical protein [Candidatus Diapherotrites archaeon]